MLGFIESTGRDDAEKNRLCPPVAQVDVPLDWVRFVHGMLKTSALHATEPDITAWQASSRLNLTRGMENHLSEPRMKTALDRWQANAEPALKNAERLLAEASSMTG